MSRRQWKSIGNIKYLANVLDTYDYKPIVLLEMNVKALYKKSKGMSHQEKIRVITEGFINDVADYELHAAKCFRWMKGVSPVIDWFPIPKLSVLDELVVDFIVIRDQSEAVCLQVTSHARHAVLRKRRITKLFGEGKIGVVTGLTRNERKPKSDSRLIVDMIDAINSKDLTTIEV